MIELYNALKFIIMLFYIQKTFYLGVAFLKSVSIKSANQYLIKENEST